MQYDYGIIGGGAAGLAAAVFLTRFAGNKRVVLLEKQPRVGKKLLATGNGTCNLTNIAAEPARYHGNAALAEAVLSAFSPRDAVAFFTSIGVDCLIREDGRVYPYSQQAGAVLDALRLTAEAAGAELRTDTAVTGIEPGKNGFSLLTETGTVTAEKVLVTVGGAASPALGGDGTVYRLLTQLGHQKTPLFPSLVQLRTQTDFVRAVKGLRVDAAVGLYLDGTLLREETGEVLFTDYGLSGPAVMQVSRFAGDWERKKDGQLTAVLDLLPEWEPAALKRRVEERSRLPGRTLEDLLTGLLHKRVGQTVRRVAGVLPLTRPADTLTPQEISAIAATAKRWVLPVTGTQGFGGAQVTAGGIDGGAFDPATLESKRVPGLYAAGEVLDVDGDCGGFNLQFAWSSAFAAAKAMAGK